MRKHLNNPWIVTALALMAVAFVASSLRPQRAAAASLVAVAPEPLPHPEPGAEEPAPVDQAASSVPDALQELARMTSPRDPFAARVKETLADSAGERRLVPDKVDTVRLSAIWTQEGRTYVLINGRVHQAGDEISNMKIESATRDGVWMAHWKGRDFLPMGSDFTLVTPGPAARAEAPL